MYTRYSDKEGVIERVIELLEGDRFPNRIEIEFGDGQEGWFTISWYW